MNEKFANSKLNSAVIHLVYSGKKEVFINLSWNHPTKERLIRVVNHSDTIEYDDMNSSTILVNNQTVQLNTSEPLKNELNYFVSKEFKIEKCKSLEVNITSKLEGLYLK